MQTFLPFADFLRSAEVLDYRRLGKQRVEAFQLLIANGDKWALTERELRTPNKPLAAGWKNHPAARMWVNYPDMLRYYYNIVVNEWIRRGYKNTMRLAPVSSVVATPHWLGKADFHASHRSNLLRKNPDHYSQFNWSEGPDLEYVWPC